LLADIAAGKVDIVVVYKTDRLTRSIRDFSKIMEVFDAHEVSLVAVTQSFNTSTSMGRLTLHMLLSFAQFERELASERTRDKIALQRQRGQWTGGRPMLGYDITPGGLVINEREAAIVRNIFRWYLELKSLSKVVERLAAKGISTKAWTSKAGTPQGGHPFAKSRLAQMLGSILYVGRVPHKAASYPGLHAAIIDPAVFRRVQEVLMENARCGPSAVRNRHGGLLKGLLVCGCCGKAMVHSFTTKGSMTHRYYCCRTRSGVGAKKCRGGTIPAGQVEEFVLEKIKERFAAPELVTRVLDLVRAQGEECRRDFEAQRTLLVQEIDAAELLLTAGTHPEAAERHAMATGTLRDVERQLVENAITLVDRATVEQGLKVFTPIWVSLSPTERASLLAAVVGEVVWNGSKGEISITLLDERETTSSEEEAA
jgi:site-specific DNA recombinase